MSVVEWQPSYSYIHIFEIMIPSAICTALLVLLAASCSSFVIHDNDNFFRRRSCTFLKESLPNQQIDVSDLGLTMDDFKAPLPNELLEGVESSGYDSTSRLEDVQDDACSWTETPEKIKAILTIPGLRGQPAMCLSVLTATNTVSITAFGYVVWSCILKGYVKPETAVFETEEGSDRIPVVTFEVEKADAGKRWDGFILGIGEDSIL
jgi:hypothetical protein